MWSEGVTAHGRSERSHRNAGREIRLLMRAQNMGLFSKGPVLRGVRREGWKKKQILKDLGGSDWVWVREGGEAYRLH